MLPRQIQKGWQQLARAHLSGRHQLWHPKRVNLWQGGFAFAFLQINISQGAVGRAQVDADEESAHAGILSVPEALATEGTAQMGGYWQPAAGNGSIIPMSQGMPNRQRGGVPVGTPVVSTRPRFLDYFLILLGSGFSLVLAEMSGLRATEETPGRFLGALMRVFPHLLFLPLGILLCWPMFYTTQKILGRQQTLTIAEWLWGLAWLADLFLTVWILWKGLGTAPGFLGTAGFQQGVFVGYIIFAVSLAVIALIVLVIDIFGRWPQPWTHAFGLALMIWPVVPLLVLLLGNIKLE
jgi:hypothetical protein